MWGGSSAGRALRSQCRGREFDPPPLHHRIHKVSRRFSRDLFLYRFFLSYPFLSSVVRFMRHDCLSPHFSGRRVHVVLINACRVVNAKGGMEKVFCDMANELVHRGFEVSAICFDQNKGLPGYPLDSDVQFINAYDELSHTFLDGKFMTKVRCWSPRKKQRQLNRFTLKYRKQQEAIGKILDRLKDVDIFISYQTPTTFVLRRLLNIRAPVVTMLHGNPSFYCEKSSFQFFKGAVEESNVVQVLRPEFADEARKYLKKVPITVIPNIAPQFKESADLRKKKIINVARLDPQKDPELLVRAFSLLKDQFPDWICEWWGETTVNLALTAKIEELIAREGLEGRFLLRGVTDDVPSKLRNASIFAFPSSFEGFSLALAEGFAMGLPAVGRKDCPSVNTLIRDGKNGFLTDATPEAFAAGLAKLMDSEELRYQLGLEGKVDMEVYSADRVWGIWEKLILDLVQK